MIRTDLVVYLIGPGMVMELTMELVFVGPPGFIVLAPDLLGIFTIQKAHDIAQTRNDFPKI